ncbi:MAG: DUF2442 domain-containing protein [Bryobacterales bacterium]|nr:DUF2442 domain-containing protein [Bryobacterales bacterium]
MEPDIPRALKGAADAQWWTSMSILGVEAQPRAREIRITEDGLIVALADGRKLSVPLAWFPRLLAASPGQGRNFEILGEGEGIHWPEIDEDLGIAGLLRGASAPRR